MKQRFLITGARGQLAQEFARYFAQHKIDYVALDRQHLNIANQEAVEAAIKTHQPDVVLNCAAYNHVNQAQIDFESALDVNARAVGFLANACQNCGALLVHYSSDFVFDGQKKDFYSEDDKPGPINLYGESKLKGEEILKKSSGDWLLLRVSWVFGHGPGSFLGKLDKLAAVQPTLFMTTDYISIPTYTKDIVAYTLMLLEKGVRGTYNMANSSYASKYELAKYYLKKRGLNNLILPVTSNYFPQDVKRPYFSALSTKKLEKELNIKIPDWTDALDRYIKDSGK